MMARGQVQRVGLERRERGRTREVVRDGVGPGELPRPDQDVLRKPRQLLMTLAANSSTDTADRVVTRAFEADCSNAFLLAFQLQPQPN